MKKILIAILFICLVILIIFAYKQDKIIFNEKEYNNFKERVYFDYKETLNDIYVQEELVSADLTTKISNKLKELDLKGGLTKYTLSDIGEGYIPKFIIDGGYEEWYTVTTSDGVYYIICQDDEIRVQKDNGN